MEWIKGSFNTKEGIRIAFGKGIPDNPQCIIVLVHGFAEHMGRYRDFIEFLQLKGFGVYTMDHIGHGKSGNIKGYVRNFGEMIDSVNQLVQKAKTENPNRSIYMFGHSMGGLITLAYGLKYPDNLDGQIVSGPALGITMSWGVRNFLSFANTIAPKLNIKNPVSELICRDKNVVEKYKNDPLVLHMATISLYYQVFVKGIKFVTENMAAYNYPCLILHGKDDKIVNPQLSDDFYTKCSSKDKSIKFYEGLYHEILNEPEKDKVKKDILLWINERI